MDDRTELLLLTTPVKRIKFTLLCEYTWSANGRDDLAYSADEYRHFLPRYFDFIAHGHFPCHGNWEVIFRQLGALKYREHWPQNEVDVVDEFFAALLMQYLSRPLKWSKTHHGEDVCWSEVDDILCMSAYGGASNALLFSEWERSGDESTTHHAACLIKDCVRNDELGFGRDCLPNSFWSYSSEQALEIRLWLFGTASMQRLDAALISTQPGRTLDLLKFARNA